MSERPEVLVVGGGLIGLSVAYELLQRGRSVRVLERDRLGRSSTWAAAGMLAPISEADRVDPHLVAYCRDSLGRFAGFVKGLEERSGVACHLLTDGTLHVAVDRDQEADLRHLEQTLTIRDLPTRRLTNAEVLEREPRLSGRVLSGLLVENDYQVDPRAMIAALEKAVAGLGGELLEGHAVHEIREASGRVVGVAGKTSGGESFRMDAPAVLLAAGAWSTEGIRSSAAELGVRPVKGQLIVLRGERLLRRLVWTPEVYFVPRESGELFIGGTVEEMGFDLQATAGAVWDILREAWAVVPGLYDLDFVEVAVGLRPAVADHNPVIGPGAVEGLWLATGHFRNGILLAPATGQDLAAWMATGERPASLAPFGADRLAGARVQQGRGGDDDR